ncbi:hypothetical protein AMAG_00387 [Allomyces macrogynus ATCC 38327]|uniref:Uncharacterized protein n=1 Tax=Allomyces macrogynus (strain ATCC 38327) TaxID=578462 RepID=A0A0L0RVS0_ALLM3|nr:hypothetical protein AMAG_00387 [Allomyces macrogynus ATCC 38327]|eukprot:KNE54413.1 hypothetical protein AMAG_00387 [Allomyces macrogynus ATCC 38327]
MASPRSPVMDLFPNDGPADADLELPAVSITPAVPVASAVPVTPVVAQPTLSPVNAAEHQYQQQQQCAMHSAAHQHHQCQQQPAYQQPMPAHQLAQQPALHQQQAFPQQQHQAIPQHQAYPQQPLSYYQPPAYQSQSQRQQQQVQQTRTSAPAVPDPTSSAAYDAHGDLRTGARSGPALSRRYDDLWPRVAPRGSAHDGPPGAGVPPPPTASIAPNPALRAASPTRRAPPTHMHSMPAMWTPAAPVNTAAVINIQPGTAMPPPPTQTASWAPPKPAPVANALMAGHYVGPMMGNSPRVYQQGDSQTTLVDDMSGSWVAKMSKAVGGSVTAVFDKVWSGAPVAASTIHQAVGNVKSTAAAHAPAGFLSTTRGKSPRPEAGDRLV